MPVGRLFGGEPETAAASGQISAGPGAAQPLLPVPVQIEAWKAIAWLRHGLSTRSGGVSGIYRPASPGESTAGSDLNLGWTKEDDPANVAENRRRIVAAIAGSPATPLVTLRQVHSAESLVVPDAASVADFVNDEGRATREADGLMTAAPAILLGVQTADCVPVLVADTRNRVVAAFHAGWRGTAARIVEQGIARLVAEFNSRPGNLIVAIGPSIGPCCYTVGEEVHAAFTANFTYGDALFRLDSESATPGLALDLWEANRRQLIASGIPPERISAVAECTGCAGLPGRRRYFSHRCEKGFTGRMMNLIGIAG